MCASRKMLNQNRFSKKNKKSNVNLINDIYLFEK